MRNTAALLGRLLRARSLSARNPRKSNSHVRRGRSWVVASSAASSPVVVLLACALPLLAHAQSVAPAKPAAAAPAAAASDADANVTKARMHFLLGMQFFEVRAYRDAIREFELATSLAPSADVWFNIGRAREELGEDEQAKAAFERYLRDRVDAPDAASVRARLSMIEQRIRNGQRGLDATSGTGTLRIHVPPNARESAITLDGKSLRGSAREQPMILPAGRHSLEVAQAGYVPFRAEVSIEPGVLTAAHARLDLLSSPPSAKMPSSRTWTWVALGLAGASAIATGVMGGIAIDHQSDGDAASARTWARRSDVALAGTSVCALAAAILYFVEAPAERAEALSADARAQR